MAMMKPVAQVRFISALDVCRKHVNVVGKGKAGINSQLTTTTTPTAPPPTWKLNLFGFGLPVALPHEAVAAAAAPTLTFHSYSYSYFGNPCLDLFFRMVEPDTPPKQNSNLNYLNQLLPLAWSHNPLTTLKLICNLLRDSDYTSTAKNDVPAFYAAASWLLHHHPKTLASNLPAIAGEFCSFLQVLGILFRALQPQYYDDHAAHVDDHAADVDDIRLQSLLRQGVDDTEDMIALAKFALERYDSDPAFRFLHDRVSDLFADCLRSDIDKFKQLQFKLKKFNCNDVNNNNNNDDDDDDVNNNNLILLELTTAGLWCPYVDSLFDCATLLSESIAKKIFPRISYLGEGGFEEDEAEHAERARELLMKEVLLPLQEPLETPQGYDSDTNRSGYHHPDWSDKEPWPVHKHIKYLEEVKAGGKSKVKAGAMLPHEIIQCVYNCGDDHKNELRQVAELQWKSMVEEVYLKQGKFKNCVAVCDVSGSMMRIPIDVSVGLGLLMSQLNEEPAWNGKVITFNRSPQMLSVQGNDLRSKCAFVRGMDNQDWHCEVDFQKVFDLILQVAVSRNLKPEQMIKRVFVFTIYFDFDEISFNGWEIDYEAIQCKFKEKGYVVPHLVVWSLSQDKSLPAVPCTQPGVTMLSGFINDNLVKSFLDNDGDIGPEHVMEAALSTSEYQTLVVVD